MTRPAPARCPRDHTCPNVRSHDSYSAWRYGCRSPAAEADSRRYSKLRRVGRHPRHTVPSGPSARRLRACAARGWRMTDMAARSPLTRSQLARVLRADRPTVTQRTARHVDDLFRDLWWRDGPSQWMRTYAAHQGWYHAMAYDDLDNMKERPKFGRQQGASQQAVTMDRRAVVDRLTRAGHSIEEIVAETGFSRSAVNRHRRRLQEEAAA